MGQSGFHLSKLSLLVSVISHSNEQHGYMVVYLRLKGIVPPSTEAMKRGPLSVQPAGRRHAAGAEASRDRTRLPFRNPCLNVTFCVEWAGTVVHCRDAVLHWRRRCRAAPILNRTERLKHQRWASCVSR